MSLYWAYQVINSFILLTDKYSRTEADNLFMQEAG